MAARKKAPAGGVPALVVEMVALDDAGPDPANVNVHDEANIKAIMASLRKFGQQKPIVVDRRGIILAGNGTHEAAGRLGWSEIAVVRSGLTGADAVGFAIGDNKTGRMSYFDDQALAETLRALQGEADFDLEATGFTEGEVDKLLERMTREFLKDNGAGGDEDEQGDAAPAAPAAASATRSPAAGPRSTRSTCAAGTPTRPPR